jgi:hypothetical protein
MTCSEVQACLSLYLYGELDFANEELVEVHLDQCALCQFALNREKEWHAAVNKQQQDIRPEWLAECRAQLRGQIACEPTSAAHARHRIAAWCRGFFDFRTTERSYRLAAVSFLVLLGFGAGRVADSTRLQWGQKSPFAAAGFIQPPVTQVQAIQPEPDNRVRIILQQVQTREVLGSRDDDGVRALLVGAARESVDPGVRMDSVEMLEGQSGLEIRDAIVNTIKNDPNAAVRVRAIQGLRRFQSDSVTRGALEFALAHDRDPGVRAMAMDALVPAQGDFEVTPQLMQTISNVMQSSQGDDYIRLRCAQILNGQASSNGIY